MNKEVGKKILKARKEKKMSRKKLGEIVGLHESTIKKYEDGNIKSLSIEKLKDFSKALDIELLDMIDIVSTEEEIKSANDALTCVSFAYQSLTKLITNLYKLGLEKDAIKNFIQKHILDDSESPLYEYTYDRFINVYKNIEISDDNLIFGTSVDKIINPYTVVSTSTFSLVVADESMLNTIPKDVYAIILREQTVANGDIALVSIDGADVALRKFYHLNDSTIVLQPDTPDTNFKTSIFEGEDIKRIKVIGKYIGYVSPFQQVVKGG